MDLFTSSYVYWIQKGNYSECLWNKIWQQGSLLVSGANQTFIENRMFPSMSPSRNQTFCLTHDSVSK